MGERMNIGEAARAAGMSAKMIRHYEALGLVPEPPRTEAGYRRYGEREIGVLRFVRESRALGFPIAQIERLLALWTDAGRESREVRALAREHLEALDRRLHEMAEMKAALERLAGNCRGDQAPHCPILEQLAGGAAPAAPAKPAKPRAAKAPAARAPAPARHDVGGLTAWMHAR
ncbi:MAG TPA: Cu(I)-responsive transcriptional regulator [Albitalea sp.]